MRFQKGKSGNPGGRPKKLAELQELYRENSVELRDRLLELAYDADGRVAVAAIKELNDRAWGKPTQPISGPNGGALPIDVSLSKLTPEQLEQLERIRKSAAGE
jgi:hypothetical protein